MKNGLITILVLSLAACSELIGEHGNGERVTKTFTVDDFNEIEIAGDFNVTLTPSNSNEVTLEVDENLVRFIEISVRGGRLIIDTERRLESRKGINVEIPVKELRKLTCSGAADLSSNKPLVLRKLDMNVSGAGKFDLKLDVKSVSLDLSGATLVYLEGAADDLEVNMSGAGSLAAGGFEVRDCSVDISGVGSALVNVSGTLKAQVSGLGKVEYLGNPESVQGDVSGVGNVNKVND
jgi:Putative auto-transporter adhesin, head GIN domain